MSRGSTRTFEKRFKVDQLLGPTSTQVRGPGAGSQAVHVVHSSLLSSLTHIHILSWIPPLCCVIVQDDVFAGTRMPEMVEAVLDGYHATVFAYGQVPHTAPMHAASRVLVHQHWPCMCMCMCVCTDWVRQDVYNGGVRL